MYAHNMITTNDQKNMCDYFINSRVMLGSELARYTDTNVQTSKQERTGYITVEQ